MLGSAASDPPVTTDVVGGKLSCPNQMALPKRSITVISGGTAANNLVDIFSNISENVTFVLPISDNGGSTSEIIRVIGGPAIGDIRSRIMHLITEDAQEMKQLFAHRLESLGPRSAKQEWNEITDGTHPLWHSIPSHVREMVRPFLIHVDVELLKRSRPGREFIFENASVGNLFLTGARLFCGSLESAIELFCRIASVPRKYTVLPCINTNFSYHIAAELNDGKTITGQCQISHPSEQVFDQLQQPEGSELFEEAGHLPFTHPALTSSQLHFSKDSTPLASPIRRIFYINPYGQEIQPKIGPRVSNALSNSQMIIYSIGSLYTSLVPVVLLNGFAKASENAVKKVLILNGAQDRETSGMHAYEYIKALVDAGLYSMGLSDTRTRNADDPRHNWATIVSDLIYLESSDQQGIYVDVQKVEMKGIRCHAVKASDHGRYDLQSLQSCLAQILNSH